MSSKCLPLHGCKVVREAPPFCLLTVTMRGIDFLSIRDCHYNHLETTIVTIKLLSSQICFYYCYCYYCYYYCFCYCYCPCQTRSKLKCVIPIWENSEECWYLMLKKFVFPKVLANWKKKTKSSVELSRDNTSSLTKMYNLT